MPADAKDHGDFVDAWFARTVGGRDLAADELLDLLDRAMVALWGRAGVTLGEITLTAIVDRVLYTVSESYPAFAALKITASGVSFAEVSVQGAALPDRLPQVVRSVLAEFITVIGNLTDEILTAGLRETLASVALDDPGNARGDDDGAKRAR
jgi:hypothetical protein